MNEKTLISFLFFISFIGTVFLVFTAWNMGAYVYNERAFALWNKTQDYYGPVLFNMPIHNNIAYAYAVMPQMQKHNAHNALILVWFYIILRYMRFNLDKYKSLLDSFKETMLTENPVTSVDNEVIKEPVTTL